MESLSEETNCFSATLYIDGKKTGEVNNSGRGGCNHYYPFDIEKPINEYAKTLPPLACDFKNEDGSDAFIQVDADILISDILENYLQAKATKRLCANKTLYRIEGETYAEGEYSVIKQKFAPEVKRLILKRYAGKVVTFLNESIV